MQNFVCGKGVLEQKMMIHYIQAVVERRVSDRREDSSADNNAFGGIL